MTDANNLGYTGFMRKPFFVFVVLFLAAGSQNAFAQSSPTAFEQGQKLRNELSQLHDREAEIKIRLAELDYELKPENIERHFAGVGSVHPEELREARRKQLQIEKDRLVGQLNEIDQNQARLEIEIQLADSKAYQQNAVGASTLKLSLDRITPFMAANFFRIVALVFALIVVGIALAATRRRRSRKQTD